MNRLLGVLGLLLCLVPPLAAQRGESWSGEELKSIRALWIGNLGRPAYDPSNEASENPRAAELGHRLFFDTRFSLDGTVASATCHKPELGFQDGLPLGVGIGRMNRRTMPIAGTSFSPWLFWDGRKDSQWAQALGPLESPVEHGGRKPHDVRAPAGALLPGRLRGGIRSAPGMSEADRQQVSRVYANNGKAIAAYERQIMPGPSRFDAFAQALLAGERVKADTLLSGDERAGLRLFTNNDFHNTGGARRAGSARGSGARERGAAGVEKGIRHVAYSA